MKIEQIDVGLFRILVPFEDEITTTVYVVLEGRKVVLIDSATKESDVDQFIFPALREIGVTTDQIAFLLLTHSHLDHAGGATGILRRLPGVQLRASFRMDHPRYTCLRDGEIVFERLQTLLLPGHTEDSLGFFDLRTKTLLSGDCLQLKGIGKYRNGISFPRQYRQSIERLKKMDICRIVAAHEYDPLGSVAQGKREVLEYLQACLDFNSI